MRDQILQDAIKLIEEGELMPSQIRDSEILSEPEKRYLIEIAERRLKDILSESSDDIDRFQNCIFTWGCEGADKVFTPIQKDGFILFAGTAGSGKTEFTFDLAIKNAAITKEKILYLSLEMNTDKILTRKACAYAGITKFEWQDRKRISDTKREIYFHKKQSLKNIHNLVPMGIDGTWSPTLKNIFEKIKEVEPVLVFIDNFNLIQPEIKTKDTNETDDIIARGLMDWTKENQIPIIAVHHLNKGGEIRGNQKIIDHSNAVFVCKRADKDDEARKNEFLVLEVKDRLFGLGGTFNYTFQKGTFIGEPQIFQ